MDELSTCTKFWVEVGFWDFWFSLFGFSIGTKTISSNLEPLLSIRGIDICASYYWRSRIRKHRFELENIDSVALRMI